MLKLFLTLFLVQICLGVQEYYVGGLKNNGDSSTTTLLITGREGTTSVTIRNISTTISSFTLANRQSVELVLPYDISVLNSSYSERNKGIKIHSSAAVSVVVLSQNGNSSDAYQMHEETSHNQLGNYVYYALTPGANSNVETVSSEGLYYSQILLLGRESETSVTIKPTQNINISTDLQSESDLELVESGSSYTGVLHEYQTLLIQSPLDLTLTQIMSTKPLTVITGHECASFGSATCSYIAEQIPPTIDWGAQFILSPLATNDSQNHIILNSEENQDALITLSCTNGSTEQLTIPPGSMQYTSGPFGVFCTLDSSSTLLVGLITNGSHPLMSLVPPILAFQSIELRFTSFSCTTKTYITLLLHNFNASNSNTNIDPSIGITRNAIQLSGNNSAVSLTIDTELSNYTGLVVVNSSGALVYSMNDDGNSCHFSYTPNWSRSISASILTFAKSSYTVSEGDESVLIGINRTLDLNTETQAMISVSGGIEGHYVLGLEDITFSVGETFKTVMINITNNEWAEPSRQLTLALSTANNRISPFKEATLTILDDDSVTIGLISMTYQSKSTLLIIESGITRGALGPGSVLSLVLRLQNSVIVDNITFSYEVVRQEVKLNLSLVDICSGEDMNNCILTTDTYFLSPPSHIRASLGLTMLAGTLHNITTDDGGMASGSCDFIIGEFTRQSLVIAASTVGILLLITLLSAVFGIVGCIVSIQTRRKWTLGGGLNKLYFQDDAMSLATNDPESYELMNRLGERKTATLAINDDNEY